MKSKTASVRPAPLLGAHFSIAKGLHHAVYTAGEYGCTALQIFTKNASTWKERILDRKDIQRFGKAKSATGIHCVASHGAYLINPASPETKKWHRSKDALRQEMIRSSQLDIAVTVIHPGAHMGAGLDAGIRQITECINAILSETTVLRSRLLLETTAGQGTSIGHTFEQLAAIVDRIERKDLIGVCLDTAHIFAAGYDIRDRNAYERTIRQFDASIGLKNLFLIHLNDSKKELGSRVDRHEHIGSGAIGLQAFACLMNDPRLATIPKIIETPKGNQATGGDSTNLATLRRLHYQDSSPAK